MAKKSKFQNTAMRVLPVVGGAVLADVAFDVVEDYVLPMVPQLAAYKETAPVIVLAAGMWMADFYTGKKGMSNIRGIGEGMAAMAGVELARQLIPGLGGSIGKVIQNPLIRTGRTVPGSLNISN